MLPMIDDTQSAFTTTAQRWAALAARDPAADGLFWYSVRTMGVYCRPSCPSRPARPENVAFHDTAAAAEAAGFRPCKRCRPDDGLPRGRLAPVAVAYAIGDSVLGPVLVAVSPAGICAILLGEDEAMLVADLQGRLPRARLTRRPDLFAGWMPLVLAYIADPARGLDLPLDPRGTDFERRVWAALRDIPPGQTASYAEVAARIDAAGSARAVARACAANPIAVVIPCHRVLRGDGGLSGYRWGLDRKEALLAAEAA